MSDDRPPVYYEKVVDPTGYTESGEVMVIRASAIGSTCLWELAAAGQGYDPGPLPDVLVRAFREGNELESVVIEKMKGEGWVFRDEYSQHEKDLIIAPGILVRSHPDGIGAPQKYMGEYHIVEVKCLSNDNWQKFVRHGMPAVLSEYKWQASVMMHAWDLPLVWAGYNKGNSDGTECEDKGRIHYQFVPTPPINWGDLKQRAEQIRDLVEGDDLLESGRPCDDTSHWPCLYIAIRPEPEVLDRQQGFHHADTELSAEVDRLVREYLFHKGQHDESKSRYEAARDRLIAVAEEAKARGVETDKWVVPVVSGSSSSLDFSAMPEEFKRKLDTYRKPTKYKYIRGIKPKE